jgi:hypothetical protein
VAEATVVATATSAATRATVMTVVKRAVTEANAVNKAEDTVMTVVKRVAMEASVAKTEEGMVVVKDAKNMASVVTRVVEDTAEVRDAKSTAQSVAMKEVVTATTAPAEARADMAETTDARSPLATVTDQAADQDTAAMATKTSTAHKLSATTVAPVVVAEGAMATMNADTKAATADTVVETTLTATVLQGVKKVVATRATEATQAPMEASSHPAHHTAAVTVEALVAQTSSPVPLSTLSRAEVALATPTSSAWLSVC